MVKTYVLDTNILMTTEGKAITGFDDNNVVIPSIVLEELDNLKTAYGEKGFQAREAVRAINSITAGPSEEWKYSGYKWPINEGKGTFGIYTNIMTDSKLPKGYEPNKPDNIIIDTALKLSSYTDHSVILITNDVSMKIKGIVCGLNVQGYLNDQIDSNFTYTGRRDLELDDISEIFDAKSIPAPKDINFNVNEYIHLTDGNSEALCKYEDGNLILLEDLTEPVHGIYPKNIGQRFALDALMAPPDKIPLVLLKGGAGCGKTLLALAAALDVNSNYDKIICARSNTLSDADIGFLPGDIESKTMPLLAPMIDNLLYLLTNQGESPEQANYIIEDMTESGIIEITSLAYIRGRSLPKSYIIIDEAQNLTRTQAKTIVTRSGVSSKVVFCGDIGQIDNPKLDKKNNGLSYLAERFKNSPLCAQVEFYDDESVRSQLSLEALRLLD